jgi:hypothetical protein
MSRQRGGHALGGGDDLDMYVDKSKSSRVSLISITCAILEGVYDTSWLKPFSLLKSLFFYYNLRGFFLFQFA